MKKLRLWLMTVVAVCLSLIFTACSCVKKDEIILSETAITLEVGATHTLTATATADVEWSTSDSSIATVDGGVVSAISAGTATITATADSATATCIVTVMEYAELVLDKTTVELREGGASVSVTAALKVGDETRDCQFTWVSANPAVATVENGEITPVSVGSTVITVSTEYLGQNYAADVSVEVKPDEYIQVSKGEMELALAEINGDIVSDTFTAIAYKAGVINSNVTLEYASSNEAVATVTAADDVATVTSVGEGTCTVSVFYTSDKGKIETVIHVTVRRSTLALDTIFEAPYVEGNTVLDVSGLDLQGAFDGIYFANEKVAAADGVLDVNFVEKNKGSVVDVELRTSVAIYSAKLRIKMPPVITQGDGTDEGNKTMPKYDGDVTALGFAENTTVFVFENTIEGAWAGAWKTRAMIPLDGIQDYAVIEFVATKEFSDDGVLTVWGAAGVPHMGTINKAGYAGNWALITDADGNQVDEVKANTLYLLHIACADMAEVQLGLLEANLLYIGNVTCYLGEMPTYKTATVTFAESGKAAPLYAGDVTEIGFAAGTEVYEYTPTKADPWGTRVRVMADATKNCTTIDFAFSAVPPAGEQLIVAMLKGGNVSIGARVNDCAVTHYPSDGSRIDVEILDADGNAVTSFEANTVYTLKIYHVGAGEVYVGYVHNDLTMYFGDVENINVDDYVPPVDSSSSDSDTDSDTDTDTGSDDADVMQGDSRKPMPIYEGDATDLGFAEGTDVVYEMISLGSDGWNVRLITKVDSTMDYVKFDFVLSFAINEFTMWPEMDGSTRGSYWLSGRGTEAREGADENRRIFVVDQEGYRATALDSDVVYTVYFYLNEGETLAHVGVFSEVAMYIANIECGNGDVTPMEREPNPDDSSSDTGSDTPAGPQGVTQGDAHAAMPTYDGNATDLGFADGTDVAYELIIDAANGKDGWTNRMIVSVDSDKEVLVFDVVVKSAASTSFNFTMWPDIYGGTMPGSYGVYAKSNIPSTDADPDRKIFVLGADNKQPASFALETVYTVYFFYKEGETHVHFSTFTDATVYIANVRWINASEIEKDPTLPPPAISQGEARDPMPTYNDDVTQLGFAADTVVYEIVGPQGNSNDVKLVAQVDATGDMRYAKLDFVLSASTSSLGLWITAANSHLGYYTITPTGFTTDGHGDASREIFVTDANGERITAFEANKVYTLYVGLDGRETTIQFTTWASLTIYAANFKCITAAEAPVEPIPPVVDGKEISILFIGNSFSDDTEAYMVDMLLNLGYTNIDVGNLYIGGCSIDTHYENILSGANAYDFRMRSHNGVKYTEYVTTTVGGKKQSIAFAIAYKDWDIISVQQASGYSGQADSYANLDALVDEVKKQATNSAVEIVFNMTWAYQGDSTHAQFPDYNSDQMTMYNAIVNATQSKVKYTVVPNGTAIQNARTSFLGDTLTRDGYHLNLNIGRFIAGLTFVAKVTGADLTQFTYKPNSVTEDEFAVAIESVQNALANPFEVTQSEIQDDEPVVSDVYAGGSNKAAVKEYTGDVTSLGFAAGTSVFEYVGEDSSQDKAAIKVDSANYDYVEFDFVITSGDGYFFAFVCKGGNFLYSGLSYVIDPSNLRFADNSAMDRTIQIFDANGNEVKTLMSTNTLYKIRIYIKEGEVDEVMIGKNGSTVYIANVKQGLESDISDPDTPDPSKLYIYQGIDNSQKLPDYQGNVTDIGFEAGEYVQEMYTIANDNPWGEDANGKTRENLAARIPMDKNKIWVTVRFSVSADFSNGDLFFVWGTKADGSAEAFTYISIAGANEGGFIAKIVDMDGNLVSELKANTVYILVMSKPETNVFKLASMVKAESSVYFSTDSITYYDEDPFYVEIPPIVSGEASSTALSVYDGSVTDLGFEEGTTVYQLISGDSSWDDRVKIAVDSTYKYVDVQVMVANGNWFFNVWVVGANGMLDGNYLVAELGGGTQHATFGEGFAIHYPNTGASGGNTKIQVFSQNGNLVIGGRNNGTIYTLRVWLQEEGLTEVQIGQANTKMYFANIQCTDEEMESTGPDSSDSSDSSGTDAPDVPDVNDGKLTQGEGQDVLPDYQGNVTDLGFEAGTYVQVMTTETVTGGWWEQTSVDSNGKTREQLSTRISAEKGKYVTIQFAVSEDIASGDVFYVWGLLGAAHSQNGHVNFATVTYGCIFDLDGYPVVSISKNTAYVLELYIEATDTYKVASTCTTGMETYFATDSLTYSDKSLKAEIVDEDAIIKAGGTNLKAVSKFEGDVTTLGFAADSEVYTYVGENTGTDKLAIKVDSANYDYVEFDFVIGSGDGWFFGFVAKDGTFLNSGESYVIDPSNLRLINGSAMDRTIQVFDENGDQISSLMSTNTLYKMRVFIKAGNVDQVMIAKEGSTIYVANVKQGLESDLPKEGPIKQGDTQVALPTYTGDETAHGFKEGEFLQYMTTETMDNAWGTEPTSGKTREQLAAKIPGQVGKYVTIKFATSEDIPSGSVFYVWGLLGTSHTKNGGLNFTTTTYGRIMDVNGNLVTSISKNTVYVLELYVEGTDTYKVSNLVKTGMELYFAPDTITYSDKSFAVQLPDDNDPIKAGGANKNAITIYNGDETALGFTAGSTVYKYVGVDSNDKISIKTDYANYDYVDVQIVFDEVSEKTWFLGFVMSGSNYLNGADAYILSGEQIRFNSNASNPLDRVIQFLDQDGNVVNTALEKGVVYTLRVYIKANNVTEIQMRQAGVTAYLANVTHGNTPEIPATPTDVEIKMGDDKATPDVIANDQADYGFAAEDTVFQVEVTATTDNWDKRIVLEVDPAKNCVTIEFALEYELYGSIYVWTMVDGEAVLLAQFAPEGGIADGSGTVVIKDADGNDVTSDMLAAYAKYTMYIYYDGASEVAIGCDDYDEDVGGNLLYFANAINVKEN